MPLVLTKFTDPQHFNDPEIQTFMLTTGGQTRGKTAGLTSFLTGGNENIEFIQKLQYCAC